MKEEHINAARKKDTMTFDPEWMPEWDDHWYLVGFAYDEDGGVIVGDTDGNWEPTDGFPEPEEFIKAWHDYSEWVLENGEDPLHEFNVGRPKKVKTTYEFVVGNSILGPVLVQWRKGKSGPWKEPDSAPETLSLWLNLKGKRNRRVLQDFAPGNENFPGGFKDLLKVPDVKWRAATGMRATGQAVIEEEHHPPTAKYVAELKKAARRHLARDAKSFPKLFGAKAKRRKRR